MKAKAETALGIVLIGLPDIFDLLRQTGTIPDPCKGNELCGIIVDRAKDKVKEWGEEVAAQGIKNAETAASMKALDALGTRSREVLGKRLTGPGDPPVTFSVVNPQGPLTPEIAGLLQTASVNGASLAFFANTFAFQLAGVRDAVVNGSDVSASLLMLALTGGALRDLSQQQAATYSALRNAWPPRVSPISHCQRKPLGTFSRGSDKVDSPQRSHHSSRNSA